MIDPITQEIIQNSLQAAAAEMFAAMRKTAMSSIICEVLDMGTGILDHRGELACSGAGIPAFVGVLDKGVKVIVAKHPANEIKPGDVYATNDPYCGGVTHLNDIIVAMADLPRGTFELTEEQDDGTFYNVKITITDDTFGVDLRDNPDPAADPRRLGVSCPRTRANRFLLRDRTAGL